MNYFTKKDIIPAVIGIIIIAMIYSFVSMATRSVVGSVVPVSSGTSFINFSTSTSVSASTTTSTALLAFNAARRYAVLTNDSASVVYLGFNTTATTSSPTATTTKGVRLEANGGKYEINSSNNYTGAISGIASGSAATVLIIEK